MRIIHIIPAAFNYFDDLKSFLFDIVDLQNGYGVEASAITLQYSGSDVRKEKKKLRENQKVATTKKELLKYSFKGVKTISEAIKNLDEYDIVHMHLPFFGAGKLILNWKKEYPRTPLVVSYYYDFKAGDFFSLIIKYYNYYFVPKLLNIADMITCVDDEMFERSFAFKSLKDKNKLFVLKSEELAKNKLLTNSQFKVKLDNKKLKEELAKNMTSSYYMFKSSL